MFRDKHFWIGLCFVVALSFAMALLVGCERPMTYDEIARIKKECREIGGVPVEWAHLNGSIAKVSCEPR